MAESPEDKDVDRLIADLRTTLDKLETAQRKDVQDEASEEEKETPRDEQPKDLKTSAVRVREHFRRLRARQDAQK